MIILYLALLIGGVALFLLSYVAQFRLASLLRTALSAAMADHRRAGTGQAIGHCAPGSACSTCCALPHCLRWVTPASTAGASVWRYSPWLGWLSWLGALAMRLLVH